MDIAELRVFLFKALNKWYLFLICLGLAYFIGDFYLEYKQPVYSATAKILIREDSESGDFSAETLFEDLGIIQTSKNLENELLVLQSEPLMESVVKQNDLQFQYFAGSRFNIREIFVNSPVEVVSWEPTSDESTIYGDSRCRSIECLSLDH